MNQYHRRIVLLAAISTLIVSVGCHEDQRSETAEDVGLDAEAEPGDADGEGGDTDAQSKETGEDADGDTSGEKDGSPLPDEYDCPDYPIGSGTEYVAAPDGSTSAAGTESDPLSLQAALDQAGPGATVTLLPGEYSGHFEVTNDGAAGDPLVVRARERHEAVLVGEHLNNYALQIRNRSHVVVRGIKIDTWDQRSQWFDIRDSDHVRFEDVFAVGGKDFTPSHVYDNEHIAFVDSVFREGNKYDNLRLVGNRHVLIEGSSFSRGAHDVLGVYDPGVTNSNQNLVIRGNVFHGVTGRNTQIHSARRVLFEHNVIVNGFNGDKSADARGKFNADDSVFRFNRIFLNRGASFSTGGWNEDWIFARRARLYHNVFDDNGGGTPHGNSAYHLNSYGNENNLTDYQFVNNVFSRNDRDGDHEQIWFERKGDSDVSFFSNAFWADGGATPIIGGFSEHSVDQMESEHPGQFRDNHQWDPQFDDPDEYRHTLDDDSSLREAGEFLTTTAESGSGEVLPVDDAAHFFDGFGVADQRGDVIAVDGVDERPRVVEVDLSDDELTLDREIEWEAGAAVSLPWSGEAPDIGVFEHGSSARAQARIDRSTFVGETGEPVEFSLEVEGDVTPEHVEWRMGDGTRRCGGSFEHTYEESYDYPVTVRVETESDEVLRAADYVMIDDPDTDVDIDSLEYNKEEMSRVMCDGGETVEEYEDGDWDGWTCE